MAGEQNSDQVRKEHLDKLGPQLGPIFSELRDDLAWLQMKWGEYRELYGTSSERIDLMNSAAGLFFGFSKTQCGKMLCFTFAALQTQQ